MAKPVLPGHATLFKTFAAAPAKPIHRRLFLTAFDTVFISHFPTVFETKVRCHWGLLILSILRLRVVLIHSE